jgi:hypothetical protein
MRQSHRLNDMKSALLLLVCSIGAWAQSCTITSPTASQLIQVVEPLRLTATTSSAPTAYKLVWYLDSQRYRTGLATQDPGLITDFSNPWTGTPFAVTWFTGLNGDGNHTVYGVLQDIFGNTLATCPTITFTVRIEGMSNQTISAYPTSNTGAFSVLTNGNNYGSAFMIDGYVPGSGNTYSDPLYAACGFSGAGGTGTGWHIPSLVTSCFPNGNHMLVALGYPLSGNSGNAYDPVIVSSTFTSTNVSGNNIGCVSTTGPCNHQFQNGNAAVFLTSGTLPTPLVAGSQWFWATSPTNASNTATISIAAGVATVTCSAACGATTNTPVYLLNIQSTNQTTGQPNCDGYYLAASGSGDSFTVNVPTACNGASGTANLEVDVNPYFLQYVDANTIAVSATPGGPAVTITGAGGSGNTIQSRMRSPYWTQPGSAGTSYVDYVRTGGVANIYQPVTFSNGTKAMQINVPYWEYHGYAGKSTDSACPLGVFNTDLTLTAIGSGGLTCSTFTYTLTQDGGITGAISVSASTGAISYANTSSWVAGTGIVTPLQTAWAKIAVSCATCGPGGIALPTVTVYVENHGNTSASVTFPHHTTCGLVATSFTTGTCHSFFPLSVESANAASAPGWLGPALTRANFNSIMTGFTYSTNLTNPAATSCTSWPDATMTSIFGFASTWGLNLEYDLYPVWYNVGNNTVSLAAILNNTGYNRQACLQGLISYLVSSGRVWRLFNDDEVTDYLENFLQPNLNIGGPNFTPMTTSGGVATFTLSGVYTTGVVWNQSAGTGVPIKVTGLTTNSACNGWYLPTAANSTTWTAPTPSGCGNGLTINATSDSGGQIVLPPSYLNYNAPFNGANPGSVNTSALPWSLGSTFQLLSSTTYITMSGSTATLHCTGCGSIAPNAVRIWYGTTANLNILAGPTTMVDANDVSFVYSGTTGAAAPTCTGTGGQCNGTTDPGAYFTVDPGWGANPLQQFYSIVNAVSNVPVTAWSILGSFFAGGSTIPALYSYEGNPNNTASAWLYVPQYPPPYFGTDVSVNEAATASDSTSGLNTRAYQIHPRSMLYADGYIGGGNVIQNCRSFQFNPGCDRPGQLEGRRESTVAQIMGQVANGLTGNRVYGLLQDTSDAYTHLCCGWGTTGTFGTGGSMSPYTQPDTWAAVAEVNALLVMREDTELQPEANKPYLGPFFKTDAHTSATYGNELKILCASEMPYGSLTVALNAIAGGSTLLYTDDGYTTRVTTVAGNPSSVTGEFCPSPGFTSVYVSQPPGYTALDNIRFTPPNSLPFGASKFLIQAGYYPDDMQADPVTDCTSGCTVAIDHHSIDAWYRVIYADSNGLPRSIGQPVEIPNQGLY